MRSISFWAHVFKYVLVSVLGLDQTTYLRLDTEHVKSSLGWAHWNHTHIYMLESVHVTKFSIICPHISSINLHMFGGFISSISSPSRSDVKRRGITTSSRIWWVIYGSNWRNTCRTINPTEASQPESRDLGDEDRWMGLAWLPKLKTDTAKEKGIAHGTCRFHSFSIYIYIYV